MLWLKVILTALIGAVIFFLDIKMQLGVAGGVPYVAFVLMGLRFENRYSGLYLGVIATVLTITGYFLSPTGGELWKVLLNRLYAGFAIWVVAFGVYYQKRALEKVKEYTRELNKSKDNLEQKIKERTRELVAALEHQKDLNDHKSRFVTIASHEFRTPLSTVLSSAALIDKYHEPDQREKREKHINRITLSVQNLVSILDDFLSLDKLEHGKQEVVKENFDLTALCTDVIEELNLIKRNNQKIHYTYSGPKDVKNLDKKLLRKVITNLLSNAIKYSGEGQVIEISTEAGSENVMLTVKDHGIGIPKEEQHHMWEQFYRASNVSNIQGTGLGLNITKRHVEMMGGSISFTSEVDKGSNFVVQLSQKGEW